MVGEQNHFGYYESSIGWIEIIGTENEILALKFVDQPRKGFATCPCVEAAIQQISEYFMSVRRAFDLPLDLHGTDFQRRVWRQLRTIPYGQIITYQEIANAIDKPQAVRAVGAANARNPISIIVPCHRVIGSDGSLTGYGGGIWRKEWLLKHEGCL
ncbi:MAG: cysteine methyltransferase [Chloroflexi bacterium RBG_16_48_8]|nr:MAG: cysteine methyltransferase [Chloroflexi bacterium RBG_16_48_8]